MGKNLFKHKRIYICGTSVLSTLGTKGGAVQTLISAFLLENEQEHRFSIATSCYRDPESVKRSKQLKKTYVRFVSRPKHRIIKPLNKVHSFFRMFRCNYQELQRQEFDLILCEGSPLSTAVAFLSNRIHRRSVPIVFHGHNEINKFYGLKKSIREISIVAPSEFTLNSIRKKCGIEAGRGNVLLNCLFPTPKFPQMYHSVEKLQTNCLDQILVLYVGRVHPGKGCLELLEAISLLDERFHLLVVGSSFFEGAATSQYEKKMEQRASKLKNRISFTGYVSHDEIYSYYDIADVCVMPSLCDEAAGLVAIESLSVGTPVISTYRGGIPEYLSGTSSLLLHTDEHFVSSLAEAIREVALNKQYKVIAQADINNIKKRFSSKRYYLDFAEILNRAIIDQ